jgi:hypothetical protein
MDLSQLSLNLVAITVFLFTLSSLLGPLLHFSQALTAAIAAVLLTIAALDTWSWGGKGATVMLDGIAGLSKEHRERVVRHEAGHFLAAHLLDIPVTSYALSAWEALRQGQNGQGGVQFDTQELETELETGKLSGQLLDRYCTIWMAGAAAEFLLYDNIQGGQDDRQKLQGVLMQLGLSPQDRKIKERLTSLRAKELLQANWSAFEALVQALEAKQSIDECRQVMQTAIAAAPTQNSTQNSTQTPESAVA